MAAVKKRGKQTGGFQSSGMIRGLCRLWSFAPRGPHPVLGPLGWIHPAQVAHHWECRKAALLLVYAQTSLPLIQPAGSHIPRLLTFTSGPLF